MVDSASGSPITSDVAWAVSASTASSYRCSGTSTRDMAKQVCPELPKHKKRRDAAACPRSASSRMIAAAWPPSSRLAGLSSAPQMDAIHRPCLAGPENVTVSTPGCLASMPAVWWVPVTRLNTPGGRSAASNASARM